MRASRFTPSQTTVELSKVEEYAAKMLAGQWDWNSPINKIIVDSEGNILSGMHRVVAAELAGVQIPEPGIYVSRVPQTPEKIRSWAEVFFK